MRDDELMRRYRDGIRRGYAQMRKRVSKAEADRWRDNALASAPFYVRRRKET